MWLPSRLHIQAFMWTQSRHHVNSNTSGRHVLPMGTCGKITMTYHSHTLKDSHYIANKRSFAPDIFTILYYVYP